MLTRESDPYHKCKTFELWLQDLYKRRVMCTNTEHVKLGGDRVGSHGIKKEIDDEQCVQRTNTAFPYVHCFSSTDRYY